MRVAIMCAALLTLAACGGGDAERASGSAAGSAATTAREAAPAISGATLDGGELSLEELWGKPVMVNAWASW